MSAFATMQRVRSASRIVAGQRRPAAAFRVRSAEKDNSATGPTPAEASPVSSSEASTSAPSTGSPFVPSAATNRTPFPVSFGEVMNFGGSAPEITNGRLAMVGFLAAVGAELSSGESVLRQFSTEPTLINMTFLLFIAASLVPAFTNTKAQAFGPFTPNAELVNGRAAMIGFAALLGLEFVNNGAALF